MDFFKMQIARLQEQLKTLNATQRMLAGALVIIILMTLYGWSHFASQAEMEPLLNQSLTSEEAIEIQKHLASSGIKYRVVGDRIEVPADRKYEAIALVGFAQALPTDTKSGFDELIKDMPIFATHLQQSAMLNEARQNALSRVLGHFPRVRKAVVMLNPGAQRGFAPAEPSATVYLSLRSRQQPDQRMVNAAADLVAGAANLRPERVKVIVDDVSYPVRSGGLQSMVAVGSERLDLIRSNEQYLRERLHRLYQHIEGVQIDVSVKPNLEQKKTVTHTVDPKNVVAKPVVEEVENQETTSDQESGEEPGMVTNAQLAAAAAPTGPAQSTSNLQEKNRIESKVDFGQTDIEVLKPPGDVEVIGVSMLVPRSHFVQVYRKNARLGDSAADPDDAALKPFIDLELAGLKAGVKTCLGLASDEAVHVAAYTDLVPLAGPGPQAAGTSLSVLATSHLKEISLGLLALVSLFMVSMMVKKTGTSPAPAVAVVAPARPPQLAGDEQAVGEAAETSPILDGMELDEESVRAQQMVSQVSNLVGENPDAAAHMVKRWLNRS